VKTAILKGVLVTGLLLLSSAAAVYWIYVRVPDPGRYFAQDPLQPGEVTRSVTFVLAPVLAGEIYRPQALRSKYCLVMRMCTPPGHSMRLCFHFLC
jgi:hypothetical protein